MSKSYNNGIFLSENAEEIKEKIMRMFTDPARLRKSDPGNPDECNLFPYHILLSKESEQDEIRLGCRNATFGCVDCKKLFIKNLETFLSPLREKRAYFADKKYILEEILQSGNEKARKFAVLTMEKIRPAMGLPKN